MVSEEMAFASELEDPDETPDVHYNWDVDFERHIASMLVSDKEFMVQSMDLIKPSYFTNKAHVKACEILYRFYEDYKYYPTKSMLLQRFKEELKEDKSLFFYLGEINSLYEYFHPGLEAREYLLDRITFFAKKQALRAAFQKCLRKIDRDPEKDDTWVEVGDLLRQALNTDRNFDSGLDYLRTARERYERMNEMEDRGNIFRTGCPSIDTNIKGGGYQKGEIFSVMAPSGVGKSVFLTCMAALNALAGKKVLYISLELSQDRVAERFDAILTGADIACLYSHRHQVFEHLDAILEQEKGNSPILIKFFPGKTADVNTIRAYLAQLAFHGYKPDMVIVDYIGEMKPYPGIPKHESYERQVSDLRALANEGDKFFCATAMQPNRGSKEAQKTGRIEAEHIAGSWDQINPLDGFLALMRNEAEMTVDLGRGSVIKQRPGKANITVYLHFDPATLRITEVSKDFYQNRIAGREDKVVDSVMDEFGNMKRQIRMEPPSDEKKKTVKPADWTPPEEDDAEQGG